jgi:hypothetical protein
VSIALATSLLSGCGPKNEVIDRPSPSISDTLPPELRPRPTTAPTPTTSTTTTVAPGELRPGTTLPGSALVYEDRDPGEEIQISEEEVREILKQLSTDVPSALEGYVAATTRDEEVAALAIAFDAPQTIATYYANLGLRERLQLPLPAVDFTLHRVLGATTDCVFIELSDPPFQWWSFDPEKTKRIAAVVLVQRDGWRIGPDYLEPFKPGEVGICVDLRSP